MISKVSIVKGDGLRMELYVSDENGRTLTDQLLPIAEQIGCDATWTFEPVVDPVDVSA